MKQIHKENRPHKRARHRKRHHVGATGKSLSLANISLTGRPFGNTDWAQGIVNAILGAISGSGRKG